MVGIATKKADRFQLLSFYKVNLMALNNVTNGSLNFRSDSREVKKKKENAFSIVKMCSEYFLF